MSRLTHNPKRKLKLGIYGPASSDNSGVNGYIDELTEPLSTRYRIFRINNSNYVSPNSFDRVLYNIGNNSMHRCAFNAMRQRPGVTVVHEFICLDYYWNEWDRLPPEEQRFLLLRYNAALGNSCGSFGELSDFIGKRTDFDKFASDFGSEKLFLRFSTHSIVHSQDTKQCLTNRYPQKSFHYVAHPVREVPIERVRQARNTLGAHATSFVFGSFGFMGEYKRLEKVLQAWRVFEKSSDNVVLLLVGAKQYDLAISPSPRVLQAGYQGSIEHFDALLTSIDCGIQLRHPCLGESSASMAKMRAHSIPLITSQVALLGALCTERGVIGIVPGPEEVEHLVKSFAVMLSCGMATPTYRREYCPWNVANVIAELLEK